LCRRPTSKSRRHERDAEIASLQSLRLERLQEMFSPARVSGRAREVVRVFGRSSSAIVESLPRSISSRPLDSLIRGCPWWSCRGLPGIFPDFGGEKQRRRRRQITAPPETTRNYCSLPYPCPHTHSNVARRADHAIVDLWQTIPTYSAADESMAPVFSSSNHDGEMEAMAIKGLLIRRTSRRW